MPKPVLPASCVLCNRPMINGEMRRSQGLVRHKSRGMCEACHSDARRDGRLDDYPRNRRPVEETVQMWEMLSMLGYTKAEAADKLGITVPGLRRALQRMRARQEQAAAMPFVHELRRDHPGHDDAVAA